MTVTRARPRSRVERRKTKGYGWKPDIPDSRDHLYAAPQSVLSTLPSSADLRQSGFMPAVYNQGDLGSCTANAIAAALEFDQKKQGLQEFTPSRLMIYYDERVIENSVDSDSGAMIRDGIKSVASQGACPESEWPYDVSKFAQKPPDQCYADAVKDRALTYARVLQDLRQMKGCLAAGYPFVFGFTVYESFESDAVTKTGIVPMPKAREQVLGGHAVVAVGYDDARGIFIVRNSWGYTWGDAGYCYMPYLYLAGKLASDLWRITTVSGQAAA